MNTSSRDHDHTASGVMEWQPIESAPRDETAIQARIPGHGDDNLIAWIADALEGADGSCGAWAYMSEQEPPPCWSDGWCWAVNEDGVRSVWPTHWVPLPPQVELEPCDMCSEPHHADPDIEAITGRWICTDCIEATLNAPADDARAEVGLVGSRGCRS